MGTVGLGGCITINTPKTPADKPITAEKPVGGVSAGDNVAAVWTDGSFYLATVQAVDGDQITVKYADDSSTKTVNSADVKRIVPQTWAVGDKVLAVWASGRFYQGSVAGGSGTTYTIKWDDGSAPSEVTSDKIVAQ